MDAIPGYDPSMGGGEMIGGVRLTLAQVAAEFRDLPIYTVQGTDIVRLKEAAAIPVDPAAIYS